VELEQKWKAPDRIESIFNRCLRTAVSVDIWKCYLNYIRRTHSNPNMTPEEKAEARKVVVSAFELVLTNVGLDKDSGPIWMDYLSFIKAGEVGTSRPNCKESSNGWAIH
jgi:cleavage stimulation factor subunit 3